MQYKYRHACMYVCIGACRHAGIAWHWMLKRGVMAWVCMVCKVGMIRMVCPYSCTGTSCLGLKVAGSRTLYSRLSKFDYGLL